MKDPTDKRKLDSYWVGPYKVDRVVGNIIYLQVPSAVDTSKWYISPRDFTSTSADDTYRVTPPKGMKVGAIRQFLHKNGVEVRAITWFNGPAVR